MTPAQVSLIISTYQQPAALEKTLTGLAEQSDPPGEVLIADDGSGSETAQLMASWKNKLKIPLKHVWHEHQGYRRSTILNKAVAQARGDYLVFSDGDCVPHPHFIADHAVLAQTGFWVQGRRAYVKESFVPQFDPRNPAVWAWILRRRISGGILKACRLPWPIIRRNQTLGGVLGCNIGCWRDDFLAINGYDEDFTGWGLEDSDFAVRLYHLGRIRKFVYGRAILYHLNHPFLPRSSYQRNEERLNQAIREKRIRCVRGIDQHIGL